MEIKELLPIGSVVLLEGGEKKLMIFGVKQTANDEEFDYIGVIYPEGNMGNDQGQFFFQHKDIKEVIFRGYEDDERENFIGRLADFYAKQG